MMVEETVFHERKALHRRVEIEARRQVTNRGSAVAEATIDLFIKFAAGHKVARHSPWESERVRIRNRGIWAAIMGHEPVGRYLAI